MIAVLVGQPRRGAAGRTVKIKTGQLSRVELIWLKVISSLIAVLLLFFVAVAAIEVAISRIARLVTIAIFDPRVGTLDNKKRKLS